jgi:hypothetical protein
MNEGQAVRAIKKFNPETPEDFKKLGLKLTCIGHGVFREVFMINGLNLVVKFPLSEEGLAPDFRAGKMHTTVEVKKVAALSKFRELRPYLPTIYYHNRKTGVLVMRYYPTYDDPSVQIEHLGRVIQRLIYRVTGVNCADIHSGNVNHNNNRCVLIDLGY